MIDKLLNWFGYARKYDINEYARRFRAGDDLPVEGDWSMSPEAAMRISAVYACVMIRANTIASLSLNVFKRLPDGGREPASDHPVARLLATPNRADTTHDFVRRMVAHLDLHGNSVFLKVRRNGRVSRLLPVHPRKVRIEAYEDALVYYITGADGNEVPVLADDVLHVRGLSLDGYWGLSPIGVARDGVSLAARVQKYGISVFETGGTKRVLLKFPNKLGDEAKENLRRSWAEMGRNSAKTAILQEGGDAVTIGMNADETQYLETRQMTVQDIARIYTMPLVLVGVHEKTAAYASTEQFDLMFGKHTIRPVCKSIEARIDRSLIGDPKYFSKFNLDDILRGDVKTRTEALKTQFMHGALKIDEWRTFENRNPIGGEIGNTTFVPNNLIPAERAIADPPEPAAVGPADPNGVGGADNEPKHYLEPFAKDIAERLVGREVRELPKATDLAAFIEPHQSYAFRCIGPLLTSAGCRDVERRGDLAQRICEGLALDGPIDVEARKAWIVGVLMAEVVTETTEQLLWHLRAAAAMEAIEKQAAACNQ